MGLSRIASTALAVTLLGTLACGPSSRGGAGTATNPAALWAAYASCLRDHGYNEPDPTIDDQGNPSFHLPLDNVPPEVTQACDSVKNLAIRRGAPPPDAQKLAQLTQFAQCMRQHGVTNFSDPDPATGGFHLNNVDTQSPAFQTAVQACKGSKSASGG